MHQIVVQKYGGTSIATLESRMAALHHIEGARALGYQVVVVVSAMGRHGDPYATDTLIGTLDDSDAVTKRDLDMLMSCGETISAVVFASLLRSHGYEVIVMTGQQAGIITNNQFGEARVIEVRPERILEELNEGKIVIVTGFQGATENGEITTLGRGGSDTTASALGVALKADHVDIYTDVAGIMTADPRIVEEARPLRHVTYYEVCNLAYQGAKVIHPRAVEIAMQNNIPIRVRNTFSDDEGTQIATNVAILECSVLMDRLVTSVTQTTDVTQIQITGNFDAACIFSAMEEQRINVDLISISLNHLAYTISSQDTARTMDILSGLGYKSKIIKNCAKISIICGGFTGISGALAQTVSALQQANIEILQTSDSHTTIWCLVRQEQMNLAIRVLHQAFHLEKCL